MALVVGNGVVISVLVCVFVFFFKPEAGIRDQVRSRGLGDVYKGRFRRSRDRGAWANIPMGLPSRNAVGYTRELPNFLHGSPAFGPYLRPPEEGWMKIETFALPILSSVGTCIHTSLLIVALMAISFACSLFGSVASGNPSNDIAAKWSMPIPQAPAMLDAGGVAG